MRVSLQTTVGKWQRYTRRLKTHRRTFKGCYWTFTGHESTSRTFVFKKKTMNVVNIFSTYWLLKHFKRLKRHIVQMRNVEPCYKM